jgi:cell division protease FtsH
MRQTFSEARSKAPCILSLDEIDSFPNRATISHKFSEWEIQVVNGLLAEIDGIEGRDGVILVAACNFPKKLDPALTRSGRLDRHFHVGLPDRAALARILREHLGKDLAAEDLRGAALAAVGASGADCESIVRTARRRARDGKREIMLADLLHAIDGDDTRTPEDQWISAVHEAGHVVATCVLRPGGLGMVSLRENDGSGGRTYSRAAKSAFVRSSDLKERLAMLLAGRAAEHEVFGIPSSGAGGMSTSDLARATNLVAVSIASFGLDEVGGMAWRGNPDIDGTPDFLAANPLLAERVDEVLADAYVAARDLVCPRIVAVRAVASALLERRVLDGAEAEAIVFQAHGYAP